MILLAIDAVLGMDNVTLTIAFKNFSHFYSLENDNIVCCVIDKHTDDIEKMVGHT
jgi:hypothetical protein